MSAVKGSFSGREKQARSTWGYEQSLQHAAGASAVGTAEIIRRPSPRSEAPRVAPVLLT